MAARASHLFRTLSSSCRVSHLFRTLSSSLSSSSPSRKLLFATLQRNSDIFPPKPLSFSPRFLCQTPANYSDSSEAEQLPEPSLVGENDDAPQIGIAQLDDEEDNAEKVEELLCLLRNQTSDDGSSSSLESRFDDMDLRLHEDVLVRVLQTAEVLTENLISFFTWALKKNPEIRGKPRVLESLVRAVCGGSLKRKEAYWLWDLVKEIGENESDVLNTQILNELIASFSKLGKGKAAMEVFEKFGDFKVEPNADTYYFTLEALFQRSMLDWAWAVCEKMIDADIVPDEGEKVGRIISWFCQAKRAQDAHLVYTLAKEKKKGYPVPRRAVNFLVGALCWEDGTVKLALEMLDDFEGVARKYAIKPFSAVIQGLCRIKDVNEAKKLLVKMTTDGPPPGNAVFNSVIHGFSKAGDMVEAIDTMKMMTSRGLKPAVYTYTVIISGYTKGGQMQEARKILSEAKKKHSKLSPVTYHTLIRAYCKLEEFDKALELLAEMEDHGVSPNVDEYNKLIQSLCLKALDWETAEKLLDEMKEKGLHLNGITRGLIRAVKEMVEEEVKTSKTSVEA